MSKKIESNYFSYSSYIIGNNDGLNLSSESQFRSKEISKKNVVDDMVDSNSILYDVKKLKFLNINP